MPHKCRDCVYAVEVVTDAPHLLICVNREDANGTVTIPRKTGICRNFRQEKPLPRTTPLQPHDSQIRLIPLTKGKVAIVDAADYDRLNKYNWYASQQGKSFYARRQQKRRFIYMHRQVLRAPTGSIVDHIDANPLNNRTSNLRLCTVRENMWNRRPTGGTSPYKGVRWRKENKKWAAQINCRGRRCHIGYFQNQIDAAIAYDKMAAKLFGPFAYLNFPKETNPDSAPLPPSKLPSGASSNVMTGPAHLQCHLKSLPSTPFKDQAPHFNRHGPLHLVPQAHRKSQRS